MCLRIWAGADGHDGDDDDGDGDDGDADDGDGDDRDGDGVCDGDQSTRSNVSIKASTDLEPSTSQSFHRLRAFH